MSDVLASGDARALLQTAVKQINQELRIDKPLPDIHNAVFHCADYKDFCNRMLDECWPLLRAQIYQDFLFRKVPTPILEHTALVHPTPWDWDVRPCARCGKFVGTPVMKTKRAWLGDDYCYACERIILSQAS